MMNSGSTKYACGVEYLGTDYKGWQSQDNQDTIQDRIESALSKVANERLRIYSAGRTDSGVHAKLMVAHFDSDGIESPENLTHRLNSLLPDDISVYRIYEVQRDAHARFDAESRSYIYKIYLFLVYQLLLN